MKTIQSIITSYGLRWNANNFEERCEKIGPLIRNFINNSDPGNNSRAYKADLLERVNVVLFLGVSEGFIVSQPEIFMDRDGYNKTFATLPREVLERYFLIRVRRNADNKMLVTYDRSGTSELLNKQSLVHYKSFMDLVLGKHKKEIKMNQLFKDPSHFDKLTYDLLTAEMEQLSSKMENGKALKGLQRELDEHILEIIESELKKKIK